MKRLVHRSPIDAGFAAPVIAALFFSALILLLISRAAAIGISHDEYQFVSGGQLFARYGLLPYLDYPFLHMPYQPVINGLVILLTRQHLLAARLLNELFIFGSAVVLFALLWRALRAYHPAVRLAGALTAVLTMTMDPALVSMDGRALNHALPLLLSLGGYVFFLNWKSKPDARLWLLLSGAAVGLAAGTRLSYLVIAGPLLLALLLLPLRRVIASRAVDGLIFLGGLAAGLLPAGLLFLADPQKFYYGNLLYIRLNTLYREGLGYSQVMTLPEKFIFFAETELSQPTGVLIYLGALSTLVVFCAQWLRAHKLEESESVLSMALAVALLAAAFVPNPLWQQYFFAPAPFLIIAFITGVFKPLAGKPVYAWGILGALVMILLVSNGAAALQTLKKLPQVSDWTSNRMHVLAQAIREQIPEGKVLSLAPLLPLEAGLETYPVLAVGPFSWRTAAYLSPERRALYGIIAPKDLESFLSQDPPAALLLGMEVDYEGFDRFDQGNIEAPLEEYAAAHGYRPMRLPSIDFTECVLWIKAIP